MKPQNPSNVLSDADTSLKPKPHSGLTVWSHFQDTHNIWCWKHPFHSVAQPKETKIICKGEGEMPPLKLVEHLAEIFSHNFKCEQCDYTAYKKETHYIPGGW